MDDPKKLATLGTQDTEPRLANKTNHNTESKKDEQHESHQKT
jgi:hypothetical protein